MKYRIGDKVRILWGKAPYNSSNYANKGEIVHVYDNGNYEVDGFSTPGYTLIFKENELTLLEEEKQPTKRQINIAYNDVKDITLEQFIKGNRELTELATNQKNEDVLIRLSFTKDEGKEKGEE